ncbi:MgtC/SapB family protein [Alkalinema pantanalense CENA528]|uniref:MgtC/SapB family protein n=1 Tax=Alkalinema pantanalense TaxID=1620705 RepID=UPI003D6E0F30
MKHLLINSNDWQTILLRLAMALLLGGIIGLNRQRGGRSAGMRTFMLVSMGAALLVMIPLQVEDDSSFATANALSRTLQGVATGVGFLGAGLILQDPPHRGGIIKVRGLTTAASIWAAAGLGATIGCGLWQMALIASFLILITLSGVKRVNRSMKKGLLNRHVPDCLKIHLHRNTQSFSVSKKSNDTSTMDGS